MKKHRKKAENTARIPADSPIVCIADLDRPFKNAVKPNGEMVHAKALLNLGFRL